MATIGGYWREAATVILAGKRSGINVVKSSASSLSRQRFDYDVLMLKRSQKSKFLPDMHVFPGGTISDADFNPQWHDLFVEVTGHSLLKPGPRFVSRENILPMFQVLRPQSESLLQPEIAFRLCAIRETFEECGILIITKDASESGNSTALVEPKTSQSLNLSNWRRRVNKNPEEFLKLCQELKVVPDIWSLYEWCNWLTPPMKKAPEIPPAKPRRFDTIFYMCCLAEIPAARADKRETTVAQWNNPGGLLVQYQAEKVEMIGPQLYELSKLCNFSSIEDLAHFSSARERRGLQRWLPVPIFGSDGYMTVLPGDDLYPEKPDFNGTGDLIVKEQTLEELHQISKKWNRMPRTQGLSKRKFLVNITPPLGYASPHPDTLRVFTEKSHI